MDQARRSAQIIWTGMVMGLVAFATLAATVPRLSGWRTGAAPADAQPFVIASLATALLASLAALVLPSRLVGAPALAPEGRAMLRHLVACGLAESSCLLCLVVVLLHSDPRTEIAALLPFAVLLSRFPSEERWEALGAAPGAPV